MKDEEFEKLREESRKKIVEQFALPELHLVPVGVLRTERTLSTEDFERIRREWMNRYTGIAKAHEITILEAGISDEPKKRKRTKRGIDDSGLSRRIVRPGKGTHEDDGAS